MATTSFVEVLAPLSSLRVAARSLARSQPSRRGFASTCCSRSFTSSSSRSSSSSSSSALLSRVPAFRPSPSQRTKPFFTPSHTFAPFFTPSLAAFSSSAFRRLASTSSIPIPEATFSPETSSAVEPAEATIPRSLPIWLYACSSLVFGILVIGGLTRLTESGLSIVEWQPITGILPPITEAEWDVEWEKYRVSPEGILTNSRIERSEFKKIFYMEWGHRVAGRLLGVAFLLPTIYYISRYRLPRPLPTKLVLLCAGIGAQGLIGWYMVKSGLEQEIIDTKSVPRVSQYRLAAHLTAALALYIGMLATALGLRDDVRLASPKATSSGAVELRRTMMSNPAVRRFKMLSHTAWGMVLITAISGAFVAGLDAGLVYNEFPTMGGRLVPPQEELMDKRYAKRADGGDRWWRNMLENPVTAQFDHRLFATTTFTVLLSLPIIARLPSLRHALPRMTRRAADFTAAAAVGQVTLGITTLLYLVPVPLAAAHQAGSVVLLTCLTFLGASLRKPGRAVAQLKRALSRRER